MLTEKIESAKRRIKEIISHSKVPEDPVHAENTLEWLLRFDPRADQALQIAALAHDIDRAVEEQKTVRSDFNDYDEFKAAHANNSANILRQILEQIDITESIAGEACRLVSLHEVGGDPRSDLLKEADSISFFEVNLPLYFKREGWDESKQRCIWGYQRLSDRSKKVLEKITYENAKLTQLIKDCLKE